MIYYQITAVHLSAVVYVTSGSTHVAPCDARNERAVLIHHEKKRFASGCVTFLVPTRNQTTTNKYIYLSSYFSVECHYIFYFEICIFFKICLVSPQCLPSVDQRLLLLRGPPFAAGESRPRVTGESIVYEDTFDRLHHTSNSSARERSIFSCLFLFFLF